MIFRLFGAHECDTCKITIDLLERYKLTWIFVDADDDKYQELCDTHDVDILPHLQAIDIDGNVIDQHRGFIDPMKFKLRAENYFLKEEKSNDKRSC